MQTRRASDREYWSKVNAILSGDKAAQFTIGQAVIWTREYQGKTTVKPGTVLEVVEPGKTPDRSRFPSLYRKEGIGKPRKDFSYVVKFKEESEVAWPKIKYLSADSTLIGEATQTSETEVFAQVPKEEWDKIIASQDGDDLEDVETQVTRELSLPKNRLFKDGEKDGKDVDGKDGKSQDEKHKKDPDKELGHHLRSTIKLLASIISEAFTKKSVTPETLKEWQRNDGELWIKIHHLEAKVAHRDAEIKKIKEITSQEIERLVKDTIELKRALESWKFKTNEEVQAQINQQEEIERLHGVIETSQASIEEKNDWIDRLQKALDLHDTPGDDPVTADQRDIEIDQLKEQVERFKSEQQKRYARIEALEASCDTKDEEIKRLRDEAMDLKLTINDLKKPSKLPDAALEHLQGEIRRLQGEVETAKGTADYYREQAKSKSKSSKLSGDAGTVLEAIRYAMNAVYTAMNGAEHVVADRQVEAMLHSFEESKS